MKAQDVRGRPILFIGPMVRAILDGQKTETRRLVKAKTQPWEHHHEESGCCPSDWTPVPEEKLHPDQAGWWWATACHADEPIGRCPYGEPGDQLWVRETWAVMARCDNTKPRDLVSPKRPTLWYRADELMGIHSNLRLRGRWRPSIHMPRWASRLTLDVIEVRVERLQDITEEGAQAEGHDPSPQPATINGKPGRVAIFDPIKWFAVEWEKLNGDRDGASWTANPWVWVVRFQAAASNARS
jgi:hypothetical protein